MSVEMQLEVVQLAELFPTVSRNEILLQLREHHEATRAMRLFRTVNYFSERILNHNKYIDSDEYKLSLIQDLKQLEWFLPNVDKDKIRFILETIGPIPNRKLIIVKLLMEHPLEYPQDERKKIGQKRCSENHFGENPEVSSIKINKTDDTNAENVDEPEMVIRNDGIAGEFEEPTLDSLIDDWDDAEPVPDFIVNNTSIELNTPPEAMDEEVTSATNKPLNSTHSEVNNIPYNPREDARNSTTTCLLSEANNTPPKRMDIIEIKDSPVANQNVNNSVEIVDSPIRNNQDQGPFIHPMLRKFHIEASYRLPGSPHTNTNQSLLHRSPPAQFNGSAPGHCLQHNSVHPGVPGPSIPNYLFCNRIELLENLPGPSNETGAHLLRENFIHPDNQPVNMSPTAWRPMQQVDSSDEDDDNSVIGMSANRIEYGENLVVKPEPPLPPLVPINEELPVDLTVDEKLVIKLMEVFPNVSPDYLRNICAGKQWSEGTFEQLMDTILALENIPTRPERPVSPPKEIDPQEQLAMLKSLLPEADPTYLQQKVDELIGDQAAMAAFIERAMDSKDYPTMKEYLRQQQLCAQHKQYTYEFKVEKFVEIFPDPVGFFENQQRKSNIESYDKYYIKWLLRKKYSQLYVKDINHVLDFGNVFAMVSYLEKRLKDGVVKMVKAASTMTRPDSHHIAIPLLQELAYFEHKEEILKYLEEKKAQAAKDRLEAKQMGLMQTCSCCFDDEVMPLDILTCTGGCRFCRECIKRSSEVAFGDGKINFPCLSDGCDKEFSLQMLQNVLDPKLFSKIAQKQAVAEVKAAGLEDLESCPFCDFANIPAPEDKIFRCLNPDCMKESCRLCKEPSHLPLRCDEVEKDEAVKARTFIENKMAEALIRECWKCGAKFIKEEGCNKMTCSCGAMMCYVCRQPVKNYKHFNGQGGDQFDLCPLYSDNILNNEKKVLEAAVEAKKHVDSAHLKNDPTVTVQKFADKIKQAEKKADHYQQRIAQVHLMRQNIGVGHNNNINFLPRLRLRHYEGAIAAVAQGAGPYRERPDGQVFAPLDQRAMQLVRHRQDEYRHHRGHRHNNNNNN